MGIFSSARTNAKAVVFVILMIVMLSVCFVILWSLQDSVHRAVDAMGSPMPEYYTNTPAAP